MYCNELHCLPAIPKPAGLFSGSAKATLIRWTSQVPPDRKQDQFRHHQHFCLAIAVISSTSYIGTTHAAIQAVCHYLVLWSSVCRRRIWEELGQLCRPTLSDYPEYVIRLSVGQPDRLDLDVVTICLMDPGGDAWRVLGLRPHLTTSNHICLLLLYKQHTT